MDGFLEFQEQGKGGEEGGGGSLNDNTNLQGESKKVRNSGSLSYRELEAISQK